MRALHEITEGWAGGLQLAAAWLRGQEDPAVSLASFEQYGAGRVRDYLVDEVLSRQPAPLQDFLLRTALVEQFSAPLAAALLEGRVDEAGAQALIDQLVAANLFVRPLDERGEWYRYERLFRATLRRQLAQDSGPQGMAEGHRRARIWLAEHGRIEAALQHALAEGNPEAAAALVEEQVHVPLDQEDPQRLMRWLAELPAALVSSRPGLLLARAAVLVFQAQFRLLPEVVTQVETLLAAAVEGDAGQADLKRGQMLVYESLDRVLAGEGLRAEESAREALSLLPADWQWLYGSAVGLRALGLYMSGQREQAERFLSQQEATGGGRWDIYTLRIFWARSWILLLAGELGRLQATARHSLEHGLASCCPILRGWAHYFLGFVHYQRNELAQAGQEWEEGAGMLNLANGFAVWMCRAGLALIGMAEGRLGEVQPAESLADLDRVQGTDTREERAALQARLALARGDTETALQWALSERAPTDRSGLLALEYPPLTRARVLIAAGRAEDQAEALEQLEGTLGRAQASHNTWRMIEAGALRALGLAAQGRHEEALAGLEQAVRLARPAGMLRVFADLGAPMGELLRELVGRGVAPQYLARILAAFAPPLPPLALLTERELQVLALLARPLGNKEIGSTLVVTTETVKKHTAHIYRKLGVNSRREAVARARQIGVLGE